ncbi:HigA family addiction module antitoxin [Methylorubrum sp. SB2]|uniref:HigA family addiction module antitoxin n=1 Tax=Methylorubrum subtropicum TaxID=3138812 RepID=UPI00313CACFA
MSQDATTTDHLAHPGGFVRREVLAPHGLSVTAAAEALGVTRQALSTFLNESADLSAEMALRIEKAFGVSMDTLMEMQLAFDIAKARARADTVQVKRYMGPPPADQPTLI